MWIVTRVITNPVVTLDTNQSVWKTKIEAVEAARLLVLKSMDIEVILGMTIPQKDWLINSITDLLMRQESYGITDWFVCINEVPIA